MEIQLIYTYFYVHAEFISVMKTVQNPTVFMKSKNNRKLFILVNCLRFSLKLLAESQAKLEIFKFLRKSAKSQGYSL